MSNKYRGFQQLLIRENDGGDSRVRVRDLRSEILAIVPHGDGIEPSTSEVGEAIAGSDLSFYAFEGIKPHGNVILHITSTEFDEPRCKQLLRKSETVITVHGEESGGRLVILGGRDSKTVERLCNALSQEGFLVEIKGKSELSGGSPFNMCSRGKGRSGIQLELSKGLRQSFFAALSARGRKTSSPDFWRFVLTVRKVILAREDHAHRRA